MSRNPSDFQLPYTSHAPDGQNGRINFAKPMISSSNMISSSSMSRAGASSGSAGSSSSAGGSFTVPGFGFGTTAEPNFVDDMLRGNQNPTQLSLSFFTPSNVRTIQAAIRREVYVRSGSKKYAIDDQDVDEIKLIMRGIYYQYAKNNLFDIQGQIEELNKIIVEWAVPRILSEIDQYQYYLKDISHLPIPMQQPQSMSSAGTRSLPFQPFT
jgi:hypothetical protein